MQKIINALLWAVSKIPALVVTFIVISFAVAGYQLGNLGYEVEASLCAIVAALGAAWAVKMWRK